MELKKFVGWFKKNGEEEESQKADDELVKQLRSELVGQLSALHNAAIVSETDLQGNITFANDLFCQTAKYTREELIGQNHRILKSGHQPDKIFDELWKTVSAGKVWEGVIKNRAKDGSYYWVDSVITPVLSEATGKPLKYVAVRFDITRQKEQEQELQQTVEELTTQDEELRQTMEEIQAMNEELTATQVELRGQVNALNNAALVSETDLLGNITFANETFCEIAGYSEEELLGKNHRVLKSGHQPDEIFDDLWKTISAGKYWQGVVKNKKKHEGYYWVVATVTPVLGKDGKPIKYISVRFDITKQKEQEAQLEAAKAQADALNTELEKAKIFLEERVREQAGDLEDSVSYARRIQFSMMPDEEAILADVPEPYEAAMLYQPREEVSGDFYWNANWKNRNILAIGDGTGHGVPGAFLSIIGVSTLAKLVEERGLIEPATILDEMNAEVRKLLRQDDPDAEEIIQDSIEMIACSIFPDRPAISYASAMRKSYIIRSGELEEIEADRLPIGGTLYGDGYFTPRTVEFNAGDTLYMFSDGYFSQMGGPDPQKPKKFGAKAFRELLVKISAEPVKEQVGLLKDALNQHKGVFEAQTDDIVVFILRYNPKN